MIAELAPEGVAAVHTALVAEVASDKSSSSGSGKDAEEGQGAVGPQGEHVCTHYFASRAIRRCVRCMCVGLSGG